MRPEASVRTRGTMLSRAEAVDAAPATDAPPPGPNERSRRILAAYRGSMSVEHHTSLIRPRPPVRKTGSPVPLGRGLAVLVLGSVAGFAVAVPIGYLAVGLSIVVTAIALIRTRARSEFLVGAYWITFCVFSTMLVDAVIPGMFYPFYVALVLGAIVALGVGGLKIEPLVAWAYVALLFVLVASLVGYTDPIPLDRLIVVPFGALVLLQFRSSFGLRTVSFAAVAASVAVSVWVIVRAVQGDFAYRGNVDVNQNVVSLYVGLGFVIALVEGLHASAGGRRRASVTTFVFLALAVMAYALVLLASRGMITAVVLASMALFVRVAILDPRRLRFFVVLLVVAALGLLLPGGTGFFARFQEPGTATGGGRVEIWTAVGEAMTNANPAELVLGHGFGASTQVVQRRFASLTSTHNAYLQVLYDFGLVGFASFLVLHGYAFARSWKIRGRDGAQMLALVSFLMTTNLFMSTPDNFMYWTALGLVLAVGTWHGAPTPNAAPAR